MNAPLDDQPAGTKLALISAASELFAENGFDTVSLRDITGRAGANVASVKYHFGSKEGLIDAVFSNHITPINEARLVRLEELKPEGDFTIRDLLCAFFEPLLHHIQGSELSEQLFGKLVGRMVGESSYEFPELVMKQFRELAGAYVPAFMQAAPELTAEDVIWRIHFSFGVMAHALTHSDVIKKISNGGIKDEELEQTFDRIINFCEAGFLEGGKK